MRRSRSAWWAIVSRSAGRVVQGGGLASSAASARMLVKRRLQIVRHAAQEVGLDGGHAVELVSLASDPGIQEGVVDRGRCLQSQKAKQIQIGRRRRRPSFPEGKQDSAQFLPRGAVHHDERAPWALDMPTASVPTSMGLILPMPPIDGDRPEARKPWTVRRRTRLPAGPRRRRR